jgi:hypothetical protein
MQYAYDTRPCGRPNCPCDAPAGRPPAAEPIGWPTALAIGGAFLVAALLPFLLALAALYPRG